jgi:23S rRNA (pseudouridine1915-N3)-methyltransferase
VKIQVVAVGRVRGALARAVSEYEERAARYWKLEVVEVDAGASGGREDPDPVRAAEGERLLARIAPGAEVVALTRDGKPMSSRKLARHLADAALHARDVSFVIGGAWGLDGAVLERASRRLSLSAMTMPHELARLVLAEQLYRAGTLQRNEPYHKGP